MTTKDLSRELCEICGIKPINKTIISCGCEDRTRHFRTYNPKRCQGCNTSIKARTYKEIHKVVFPDFTQPENFVKLLELRFTTKRGDIFTVVEALQNGRCFTFADRKSFLEQLLDYIFTCENFGEYIKQAIKSEVWKYD